MTVADIQKRIDDIREKAADDEESGHLAEDQLYEDVLQFIGDQGAGLSGAHLANLAATALQAKRLEFRRYYS